MPEIRVATDVDTDGISIVCAQMTEFLQRCHRSHVYTANLHCRYASIDLGPRRVEIFPGG